VLRVDKKVVTWVYLKADYLVEVTVDKMVDLKDVKKVDMMVDMKEMTKAEKMVQHLVDKKEE
jgi:hypothetical protein